MNSQREHNDLTSREVLLIRKTFKLAVSASRRGDQPFGAILADENGSIIGTGQNTAYSGGQVGRHAEASVVRLHSDRDLSRATLYTSTEPCETCAELISESGIRRVVFGCSMRGYLSLTPSAEDQTYSEVNDRNFDLVGPVAEADGLQIHKVFFEKISSHSEYLEKWAESYSKQNDYWGTDHSSILERLPRANMPNSVAADIGCGDGRNLNYLSELGYRTVGVDIVPSAISAASRFNSANVETDCIDALYWLDQQPDQSVAVVVANHIIQHLSPLGAVQDFFRQIARVLEPAGIYCGAHFIGPARVHPKYVRKYAYLPGKNEIRENFFLNDTFLLLYEESGIFEDLHGGEKHRHAIEKIIVRKLG